MSEGDVYVASTHPGPLRQCEIVTDLRQVLPTPGAGWSTEAPRVEIVKHPVAVVLSQDCDLTQDFVTRSSENPDPNLFLQSVVLCDVFLASEYRQRPKMSNIWKQLSQNNKERYHYLSRCGPRKMPLEMASTASS